MRILALESSGLRGSVAALDGELLVGQIRLPDEGRTAQSLAPALKQLLAQVAWRPAAVQLVAVTQGPGSFTGLRIGVTTAKSLAYAVGAEVLGVNTLEVIAAQQPGTAADVWAVVDAQRQQLFAARFHCRTDELPRTLAATAIVDNQQWLDQLGPPTVVTGPGLRRLVQRLPAGIRIAPDSLWTPQAGTVGKLAFRHYQAGQRDDLWKLVPHYYRPSAAEEKRLKQQPSRD